MNRTMKIGLLITLVVVGSVGAYRLALTQDQKTQPGAVSAPPPVFPQGQATLATNEVLARTYFSAGNQGSIFFPAGVYTAVNSPLTINCPGSTSCTIQADMWVETGNTNTNGTPNNFAICTEVDGTFLQGNCFYSANTPNDLSFVTGTRSDQSSGWSHGNHTIQTFIFTNNGTPVQQYNITYHVYKP